MAITYDLILEEVGGSSSLVEGVTTSDYALTSLSGSVDYVVKVRAVDTTAGVRVPSAYVTLAFTSAAAATAVTVNLDSLSLSSTLGSITPVDTVVPTIVDEYDLLLIEDGGSPQIIRGIATSDYALTGLTGDTSHTVAVRTAKIVNGVTYLSDWTSDSAFSTAGASAPVSVTIGSLTTPITLNIVTPVETVPQTSGVFYEVELTDVLNDTSVIYDTQNTEFPLVGLIEGTEYQVSVRKVTDISGTYYPSAWVSSTAFVAEGVLVPDLVVNLGSLTEGASLNSITPILGAVSGTFADHWLVSLIDTSDDSVLQEHLLLTNSLSLSGLSSGVSYQLQIIGLSFATGSSSLPATYNFSLDPASTVLTGMPSYYSSTFTSQENPLDIFSFTVTHFVNVDGEVEFSGVATHPLQSVSGQFDGRTINAIVDGVLWSATSGADGEIELPMPDELDGIFNIQINANGDTLGVF